MRKDEANYVESNKDTDSKRLEAIEHYRQTVLKDQDFFAYSESAWRETLEIIDFYKMNMEFINDSDYMNEIYLFIQTLVTVAVTCGPEAVTSLCQGAHSVAIKKFLDPLIESRQEE